MVDMNVVFEAVIKHFKGERQYKNNFIELINKDIKKKNDKRLKLKPIDVQYTYFIFEYCGYYYVYDSFCKCIWKCSKGCYDHRAMRKLVYKIKED